MSQGTLAKSPAAPELSLELDTQGRYLHALGATTGTLDRVPGCEGLTLDLDALWSSIDNLE